MIKLTTRQCQMRSSTQETECRLAESHMYTHIITKKHVNANCTKMLSKISLWQGNKTQVLFEQKITQQSCASAFVRGKHDRVFMAELWTTCQPVKVWQLSVCCALFTQHNTSEREQDQDSNQTLYLWVYPPLTALTELKALKSSLHVWLFKFFYASLE